jgi:hypothetical protein
MSFLSSRAAENGVFVVILRRGRATQARTRLPPRRLERVFLYRWHDRFLERALPVRKADARTVVDANTKRIALTIQSNGAGSMEDAAQDFARVAREALGFDSRVVVADAAQQRVAL